MDKLLRHQTWEHFEREAGQKKVILFGTGARIGRYFERYKDADFLEGVIDNDSKKQGFRVDEFIPEAFGLKKGEKKISDISLLELYQRDELVVLITSANYYEQMAEQLGQFGITNYFVLSIMEGNNKCLSDETHGIKTNDRMEYARECCAGKEIENKKIFFKAYADYADHGKYITEALLKIRNDLDIVWAVGDLTAIVPKGVRKVYEGNWKRFIYEMETSQIWVLDLEVPDYIIKRQQQLYIQTKHWASITLKKFYLDAVTFQSVPERIENWKRDGQMIDHIITGSDFDTQSCRRGFGFQGEALPFGSPRSDALFHESENRKKVYERYHLDMERHALLYAPTYRFDKAKGKNYTVQLQIDLDFMRVKKALEQRFGGAWYIWVRLHPAVAKAFEHVERPDFVIDVSLYIDSQELASAADITISDFSSIMFEPAFVYKPVFLFTTDLQDYVTNEYELLIPYRELPFPIAETNEELEDCIKTFDQKEYCENVRRFLEMHGVHEDGKASARTAQFISDWIDKMNMGK